MEEWNKMTVAQLKTECTNRGLETSGKKADLVQKLVEHEATAVEKDEVEDAAEVKEEENGEEEEEAAAEEEEEATEEKEEGVDEVIDAIDDMVKESEAAEGDEAEAKEGDEAKKEGEETTEGEKEEGKEEKKDEKKPTPVKAVVVKVPLKKTVRAEVMKESRTRMVVFGPLVLEDLKNDKVLEIFGKAEQFFIRFAVEGETGHAQLRLKTFEEAKEMTESITAEPFKENLVVKQLDADVEQNAKIDAILKGASDKTLEAIELRMLYVHSVPESVTEESLKQLVPEALSAIIPKDDERKSKGYAYIEFEDAAKMEENFKKCDNLTLDDVKMTLHKIPTAYNEDKPRPRYQNYNRNQNQGNRRGDYNRGGFNRGGGRQGMDNRQQGGRWNDNRGMQRGNQGGVGGQDAVNLLMGISQMLSTQQQTRGGPPPPQRGYGPQRGYDDHYAGGYADQPRKRRFDDNYGGGYNQGNYNQGGYGGGPNKRFNSGRRY